MQIVFVRDRRSGNTIAISAEDEINPEAIVVAFNNKHLNSGNYRSCDPFPVYELDDVIIV